MQVADVPWTVIVRRMRFNDKVFRANVNTARWSRAYHSCLRETSCGSTGQQGQGLPGSESVVTFTPCNTRHRSCSPAHADLVNNYRSERHRQEVELEAITGNYPADQQHWKAKGGKLITFGDWLKAHRRAT